MSWVLLFAGAYLLGAIPTGVWVSQLFYQMDIRKQGSLNSGLTNIYRVLGIKAAIPVAIVDLGKGILATWLGTLLIQDSISIQTLCLLTGFTAVIGHSFTVFAGFKGGKGVLTALGVYVVLIHYYALIPFGIWVLVLTLSGYVSLASMIAALSLFLVTLYHHIVLGNTDSLVMLICTSFLSAFIIYRHRGNIRRLLAGEENGFGKKKK